MSPHLRSNALYEATYQKDQLFKPRAAQALRTVLRTLHRNNMLMAEKLLAQEVLAECECFGPSKRITNLKLVCFHRICTTNIRFCFSRAFATNKKCSGWTMQAQKWR